MRVSREPIRPGPVEGHSVEGIVENTRAPVFVAVFLVGSVLRETKDACSIRWKTDDIGQSGSLDDARAWPGLYLEDVFCIHESAGNSHEGASDRYTNRISRDFDAPVKGTRFEAVIGDVDLRDKVIIASIRIYLFPLSLVYGRYDITRPTLSRAV